MPDARLGGGVDEGAVLLQPVGRLGSGDHQHTVDAAQAPYDGVTVVVRAGDDGGTGQIGRPLGGAGQQRLSGTGGGQTAGDAPAQAAGGAGDGVADVGGCHLRCLLVLRGSKDFRCFAREDAHHRAAGPKRRAQACGGGRWVDGPV